MMMSISVNGTPAPQGSKRHMGNGIMVESSKKVKPWRQDVRFAAEEAKPEDWDATGAMAFEAVFCHARPKKHFKSNGTLRDDAPVYVTSKGAGDIDKIVRATLDALTSSGVIFDDAQIVRLQVTQLYGPPGATMYLRRLTDHL